MRRILAAFLVAGSFGLIAAAPAFACGGLVNPNGTVSLVKTTTLAGYRWGVEHYITSFKFEGGGSKFGSIIPIPAVPNKIKRGGQWTLKRLVQEVAPPAPERVQGEPSSADSGGGAKVVKEKVIDSVRVQILKGGARAVGRWAKEKGFALPPDAPEVLDFYASRSPYFMALRFIPSKVAENDTNKGDGVPIHLYIRVDNPWVPLRILSLGQDESTVVEADVFLLTKREPNLLPEPAQAGSEEGTILERSEQASRSLLNDLRTDRVKDRRSMNWVHPSDMWFTYLRLAVDAKDLTYDLATNVRGGEPSPEDAGQQPQERSQEAPVLWVWGAASALGLGSVALTNRFVGHGS